MRGEATVEGVAFVQREGAAVGGKVRNVPAVDPGVGDGRGLPLHGDAQETAQPRQRFVGEYFSWSGPLNLLLSTLC